MLANYKIESSNYILRIASKDKGRLLLQNKQSETLVQLGELKLGRWPQLELENNCKYEIIEVDGASAIRINYFFSPSVPTSMKLTSTFIVHQDRVDVQYLLSGVPEKYKVDWKGCQFRFCLPENAGTQKLPEAKLGIWQRDTKGGLPLETADAKIFPFLIKNRLLCLTYGADNKVEFKLEKRGLQAYDSVASGRRQLFHSVFNPISSLWMALRSCQCKMAETSVCLDTYH